MGILASILSRQATGPLIIYEIFLKVTVNVELSMAYDIKQIAVGNVSNEQGLRRM